MSSDLSENELRVLHRLCRGVTTAIDDLEATECVEARCIPPEALQEELSLLFGDREVPEPIERVVSVKLFERHKAVLAEATAIAKRTLAERLARLRSHLEESSKS